MKNNKNLDISSVVKTDANSLFSRVVKIITDAQSNVVRTVNSEMVRAYWHIGKEIIEEEQKGHERAEYGENIIENLSLRLSKQFGKGYSTTNLRYFRQFFLAYDTCNKIRHTRCDESVEAVISDKEIISLSYLSWSHYRVLMKIKNKSIRSFYEIEAQKCRWKSRELQRQISAQLFERVSKNKSPEGLLNLVQNGIEVESPKDAIRDPLILEFLNLPESNKLVESSLEGALITHLQEFLLELGQGFAFIGRQQRLTLDGDHFYADLVFYHIKLKCYVIVELKTKKLSHADLGQMQLYVNYYDQEIKDENDNPTLGLVLCTDKNEAMVEYLLGKGNEQIFASRYKLFLPAVEELKSEILREVKLLEAELGNSDENEVHS